MSDSITTSAPSQPQSSTPEQALPSAVEQPHHTATPSPEAVVQEQAAQAADQAAEQEAKAREQAESTLKATVKAYRRGENAYRAGLLEAAGWRTSTSTSAWPHPSATSGHRPCKPWKASWPSGRAAA